MLPGLTGRRAILILCIASFTAVLASGEGDGSGPRRALASGSPPAPAGGSRDGWFEDWTMQLPLVGSVAATRSGGPSRHDGRDRSTPGASPAETCIEVFEFTASLDPGVPLRRQLLDAVEAKLAHLDPDLDRPAGAGAGHPDIRTYAPPQSRRRPARPAARAAVDSVSTSRGPSSPRTDRIQEGESP